jgi:predicted molibdopterin-dependent oxidoreductase YjgC
VFRYIDAARHGARLVTITIDGVATTVRAGETLAAALLQSGRPDSRTTAVSHQPRGPFCMMGICFDCLVSIDGWPNQQACMIRVREGMRVERQEGCGCIPLGTDALPGGNDEASL